MSRTLSGGLSPSFQGSGVPEALITGPSAGFSRDTAETLARTGHGVFASMRDPQHKNREHAEALRKQGIEVVELDVGSDVSVERAVKEVLARARRIDVLVNNAGFASVGVTEAFTSAQAAALFDTNFRTSRRCSGANQVNEQTAPVQAHVVEALGLGHLARVS